MQLQKRVKMKATQRSNLEDAPTRNEKSERFGLTDKARDALQEPKVLKTHARGGAARVPLIPTSTEITNLQTLNDHLKQPLCFIQRDKRGLHRSYEKANLREITERKKRANKIGGDHVKPVSLVSEVCLDEELSDLSAPRPWPAPL
jgi:hypothetical protein